MLSLTTSPGFTLEMLASDFYLYSLNLLTPDQVNDWQRQFRAIERRAVSLNCPLKQIIHFKTSYPSPYMITKTLETLDHPPQTLQRSYALVAPLALGAQFLNLLYPEPGLRVFTELTGALKWLQKV
jgi:hypothetical protein